MLKIFSRKRKAATDHDPVQAAIAEFELPTFPAVTMQTLQVVRDPESSDSAVADLVATDPGLSSRLLATVNSAAFSLRNKVRSVHHAVSLLGRNQVESMLIAVAVRDALPDGPCAGFESQRFWRTAAQRATVAGALADRIDPSRRSESFTAALLQDMALPLLSHSRSSDYGPLLEEWHSGRECLARLEREAFGWDHAGVGAALCDRWKFPEELTTAIGGHHTEGIGLAAVDLVAPLREVDVELGVEQLVERTRDEFGIAEDETVGLVRSSFEAAEDVARLFA